MSRFTFKGSNSVIFASHINWGHLIKEEFAISGANTFLLKADPIFGRLRPPVKQTGRHENCLPLKTWRKKLEVTHTTARTVSI